MVLLNDPQPNRVKNRVSKVLHRGWLITILLTLKTMEGVAFFIFILLYSAVVFYLGASYRESNPKK